MTKRSKKKNPDPKKVAAIVVGSLGAVALGALAIYAVRSSSRAGLPPALKVPLPPRANGMPSPDPIAPAKVPPTVTAAALTMAHAAPPSASTPSPIDYQGSGWVTYGWYTYKGNAPQKMWIRVDQQWYRAPWVDPGGMPSGREDDPHVEIVYDTLTVVAAPQFEARFIRCVRWTVIMGADTPMALTVMERVVVSCENEGLEWLGHIHPYADDYGTNDSCAKTYKHDAKRAVNEWIYPTAGQLAARAAADWIDIAYGGGP